MRVKRVMKFKILIAICLSFLLIGNFALADNTYWADLEFANSEYFNITDAAQTDLDLTASNDHTWEFWIRRESVIAEMTIINKSLSTGNQRNYYIIYTDSGTGFWQLRIYDSGDSTIFSYFNYTFEMTLDTWYHIAVSYDISEDKAKWWKDGTMVQDWTARDGGAGTVNSYNDSTEDFLIGEGNNGAGWWDGGVDDVRFWTDIRSDAEISDNYDCQLVGNETDLLGYWQFNHDGTDETTLNDLTENNTPTYTASDLPFTAECGAGTSTPPTASTTTESSAMPIENDIGVITSYTEIYTDSSTTPSEIRKTYYHIPFFVWLLMWLVVSFIFQRVYSLLTKNEKK